MGVFKSSGKALGELWGNFKTEQWWIRQVAGQTVQITVLNPLGKKVAAYIKGHVFHGDVQIGSAYHCADGHEYVKIDDKHYRYDPATDAFYNA